MNANDAAGTCPALDACDMLADPSPALGAGDAFVFDGLPAWLTDPEQLAEVQAKLDRASRLRDGVDEVDEQGRHVRRYPNGCAFPVVPKPEARYEKPTESRETRSALCFGHGMGNWAQATFARMDEYTPPELRRRAEGYVADFEAKRAAGQGMLFFGAGGVGKTWAAACVCNALLDLGWSPRFTNVSMTLGTRARGEGTFEQSVASLAQASLVVLDDFGCEYDSDYRLTRIEQLVGALYDARTPFIVTTNLGRRQLANPNARVVRLMDRVKERTSALCCEGVDRRQMRLGA